jgi:hypothetical protein
MSFFVTRPPVPVPGTSDGSMPCSAAIRATTGDTNVFPLPSATGAAAAAVATAGVGSGVTGGGSGEDAGAAATGSGAGSGSCSCVGAAGAAAGAPISAPAGTMSARTVPTSTVSPSCTRICATTPSAGLGTSVSTLSVEISSRLVALDRLADLTEPLRDRSLGHGDSHLGHHDLGLRSCRHRSSQFVAAQ